MDFSGQALSRRMLEPLADVLGYVHDLRELSFANCGLEDDVSGDRAQDELSFDTLLCTIGA